MSMIPHPDHNSGDFDMDKHRFKVIGHSGPAINKDKSILNEHAMSCISEGILDDGTPYAAEYIVNGDGNENMVVVIPEKREFIPEGKPRQVPVSGNTIGFLNDVEVTFYSSITEGMVFRADRNEISFEELENYVTYFQEQGVIHFSTEVLNGFAHALTDIEGQDLMAVYFEMVEDEKELATTGIDFPIAPEKTDFNVIKGGK